MKKSMQVGGRVQARMRTAALMSLSVWMALAAGCGGGGDAANEPVAGTPAPVPTPIPPAPTPPAPTPPAPSPSTGPTYYFSDCQAGAFVACVPGNNANVGTSAAAPKRDLTGFNINALPAGSRVLFAQGGVWTNFNVSLQNFNVTPAAPLVIDSYAPSWGGTAAPWLHVAGVFYGIQFGNYNNFTVDGGYVIRNLKLDGDGIEGAWGFYLRNVVRNVVIENNEITGFALGLHMQNTGDVGNMDITIRKNNVHHNSAMGLLGDANNMVLEGNTFQYNNFSGSAFNHGVYLGGHARNGIVRNNTFRNNSVVNGVCMGGNLTVHGQWDGLLVEGNTIEQDASNGGCYGISINSAYDSAEYFRNLVVRGNRIVNLGNCSICLTSAPGVIVENNLIINTQATYHAGIVIPDRTPGPGDDLDSGAIVRNNTIYYSRAGSGSEGVSLNASAGSNLQVVSNLTYFAAASNATHRCFVHAPLVNFTAFANNLCHHAGGNGAWSASHGSLTAARAAGFDTNGQSVDPLFVALPTAANSWNDQLQTGSPARDTGHPTRSSATDRVGVARTVPNIGARE